MPEKPVNFDTVREIGLALPGVEEGTAYGMPALKLRGDLLACLPSHRSVEPDSLVVRVDFDDRDQLLAEAPDIYYLTDHYVGYNGVLVRMARVKSEVLKDLLRMAHNFVSRKAKPRTRVRTTRKQKK
jgi:hypothetical protein